MSFLRKILYLIFALSLLAAPSCSSDDPNVPDVPSEPEIVGYLQLAVSTTGSSAYSRSNPTGGENGDGPEHGRLNENKIHNLAIFVYRDLGAGLDGDYPFVWKKDIDYQTIEDANPGHPYDGIYNVKIPLTKDDIGNLRLAKDYILRAVVVANSYENLSTIYTSTTSLVKSQQYGPAWTGNKPAEADRFVMSAAYNGAKHSSRDGRVIVVSSSAEDATVFSCQVTLERVAARLDLQVTTDNIGDGSNGLLYNVKDTGHKVRLTNVIPVNLMNNPSYLVKHVTTGSGTFEEVLNGGLLVAGDERLSAGIPANYVFTPNFGDKPSNLALDYTNRASELRGKTDVELSGMSPLSPEMLGTAFQFEGAADTDRAIVISYANENTCHSSVHEINSDGEFTYNPSDYLTGLLFRAQYIPEKVYTTAEVGDNAPSAEYHEGETFWMFRLMDTEVVNEGGSLYFSNQTALIDYVAANAATLVEGKHYTTAAYTNGVCYYNVWLKHANVDDVHNIPMMYGIVRNNIYRLSVTFSNIGLPAPEIDEPHRDIDFKIDVVKWVFGGKDHIQME